MRKLDVHLAEQQIQEEHFAQRIKKIENENEILEYKLKHKSSEVAKLDKQLKEKQVNTQWRNFF